MTETTTSDREPRYETKDVRVRPLLIFSAGFIASLGAIYLILFLFMRMLGDFNRPGGRVQIPSGNETARFPEPGLQVDPGDDLRRYVAGEEQVLNSYDWVDRDRGVVRIPINRAMDLLLRRGLPVRPGSLGPTELEMQQQKAQMGSGVPGNQPGKEGR
jgi:hypothetical protein